MTKEQAKDALIEVLMNQVMDLSMMSKIELGDDVIAEIRKLKEIINRYQENRSLDNYYYHSQDE
jgi:phospholipase C